MMRNKCRVCTHCRYESSFGFDEYSCEFCNFEYNEDLPYDHDDWNIFELDDDFEWSHLQILDRLDRKGVPCMIVDIWFDNNIAMLSGCTAFPSKIASALNIHEEVIYQVGDTSMFILNLYMEKDIRKQEKSIET